MRIQLVGGKLDGRLINNLNNVTVLSFPIQPLLKREGKKTSELKHLVYRRIEDTNKFYFDKIEEA